MTSVSAQQILHSARSVDQNLITNAGVFDVYEGISLGAEKKSIAIWLTIQPTKHTLTDEQIEVVAEKVIASVEKQTGGILRR